jgi:hypothetical protein
MPSDEGEVEYVDTEVVVALERAQVSSQIATAKQYPRAISKFSAEAEMLVTMNAAIAEECVYAIPRDGKLITGPSARMAEIVASTWGNCRAAARVIEEGSHFVTAQGVFIDLERNVAISYEVKRRITTKSGARFSDDMIGVTASAACSIALRNAILRGVPKVFWISAYHAAVKSIEGTRQTFEKTRDSALGFLKDRYGITEKMILSRLGLSGVKDMTGEHITEMRGIATTLKEGESTVEEMFGVETKTGPAGAGGKATEAAATTAPATPAVTTPEPAPLDYKKAVAALARKQGKTTNAQLLTMVAAVFGSLGFEAPRSYQEIGPSDWKTVWQEMVKRYDPETGQPRPKAEVPREAAAVAEVAAPAPDDDDEVAMPGEPEPVIAEVVQEVSVADEALGGNAAALVEYATAVEEAHRRAGKKDKFISEYPADSGTFYFVRGSILKECGSTKDVDGKLTALSVVLQSKDPALQSFLPSVGMVAMLARGTKVALDELEAGRL